MWSGSTEDFINDFDILEFRGSDGAVARFIKEAEKI